MRENMKPVIEHRGSTVYIFDGPLTDAEMNPVASTESTSDGRAVDDRNEVIARAWAVEYIKGKIPRVPLWKPN